MRILNVLFRLFGKRKEAMMFASITVMLALLKLVMQIIVGIEKSSPKSEKDGR